MISNLNERFLKPREIIGRFKTLFPSPVNVDKNVQDFLKLHEFYANNGFFDTFSNEEILKAEFTLWNKKFSEASETLNPIQLYTKCNGDIFPNVKKLLQIFITLPVTTSTAERSFSNLKFLKSYLRSTTGQDRLNGLALLYIYQEIELSPEDVLNELAKKKRKLNILI